MTSKEHSKGVMDPEGRVQFLEEVFPEELKEIAERQRNALHTQNENLKKALKAKSDLEEARAKYEAAKRGIPFLKPLLETSFVQKLLNLNILKTIPFLQTLHLGVPSPEDLKVLNENCIKTEREFRKSTKPSTDLGLLGLAFSGGGIRSATFNLGVLQAFAQNEVLKHVDYLSTVSGGGYLGSCVSSVLNDPNTGSDCPRFPLRNEPCTQGLKNITPCGDETPAVKHLRNNSRYLASGGILDSVRIPALLLRGILVNSLVFLPYLVLAVYLTALFYGPLLREKDSSAGYTLSESSLKHLSSEAIPKEIQENLVILKDKEFSKKEQFQDSLSTTIGSGQATKFGKIILNHAKRTVQWKSLYHWTPRAMIIFCVWIFLFPFTVLLLSRIRGQLDWNKRNRLELSFGIGLLVVALVAVIESLPSVLLFLRLNWWRGGEGGFGIRVSALLSIIPYLFAHKISGSASKWAGQIALWALGLLGPLVFLMIYFRLSFWNIFDHSEGLRGLPWGYVYVGAVILWIYARFFVDVNITSLHGFYRDRLSKAYLFMMNRIQDGVVSNDRQTLHDLNLAGTQAPYHLINAALNLPDSEDPNLRGRNADFFFFSKLYSGSEHTGYCRTENLEEIDPHLDLGSAMAISGAAAAPNMGSNTIKPLVFIMTILNIRLGYWLPNPRKARKPLYKRFPLFGVGPLYLLYELFSKINENSRYVNVSDGGHIENLAIYELLRRRCKFIIACDGEQDQDMTFGGLAKLIRYARIDLDIEIEIDLDDLRKQQDGFSRRHCALGIIRYCDGEAGYLLYLKSSVTGDESEDILEYRSSHTAFPHESTGDQFYDEAQFEAYRALGHHIANELFWQEIRP